LSLHVLPYGEAIKVLLVTLFFHFLTRPSFLVESAVKLDPELNPELNTDLDPIRGWFERSDLDLDPEKASHSGSGTLVLV
jgi:hypothetical protein